MPERLTDVFYDLTVKAKKPHHFIKLNSEVKEDMKVWLSFLESFNGKAYFPESEWSDNEILELYTVRVQRLWGFGIFEWVFFQWQQNWADLGILKDITFLEFVPIVLSMAIWGSRLQIRKLNFTSTIELWLIL